MLAVFLAILVVLGILIAGGMMSDRIEMVLRRRFRQCAVDGSALLLWGMLILAAFVLGLMVMYVVR